MKDKNRCWHRLPGLVSAAAFCLALAILLLPAGCSSDEEEIVAPPAPEPPVITSPDRTEATGGLPFRYRVTFTAEDGGIDSLVFSIYPSWLTADADSIYGTPPDGLGDTSFTVIVFDGSLADTLEVAVTMIRCILVYGDTRTGHSIHQQLVDSMVVRRPAAVFHTGDLVDDGTVADQWTLFNSITSDLRAVADFYPALGNHEKQSDFFFLNFDLPNNEQWYSAEVNDIHFIILNSCVSTDPDSAQYKWLEADLAGVDDSIRFVVAVFHHPPYSTGEHIEDEMGLRQTIVPLFDLYGVDLVFNGHDHDYERSLCGGRYYIVAGGGGAPLRDQARTDPCSQIFLKTYHYCKLSTLGNRLVGKVFDVGGNLIDQFELPTSVPKFADR